MPSVSAVVSKQTIRRDVARIMGNGAGYHTRLTTGAGTTGSLIIAALSGIGQDYVVVDEPWYLCNDGTNAGEYRRAVTFAGTTVTTGDLYTNGVASGISVDSYPYPPHLYTEAVNLAIDRIWRSCYRTVHGHLFPGDGDVYGLPRNARAAIRLEQFGQRIVLDLFNRADDAASAGQSWVAKTGSTWGVTSERLYSVTDANADIITLKVNLKNGFIKTVVRGTLNDGGVYRSPAILFRVREDYTGAVDTTTCLLVRLLSGSVDLRKNDGGTETSLATGTVTTSNATDYEVKIEFRGTLIEVWVDDVQLISYSLTGTNLKYLDYPQMGFRLDKAGAPASAARIDSVYAYSGDYMTEWRDWQNNDDELTLTLPAYGIRRPANAVRVEAKQLLTALASDTTAGALATDTAATLEITTTEPAYRKLIYTARAELLGLLGDPQYPQALALSLALPGMRSTMHMFKGAM